MPDELELKLNKLSPFIEEIATTRIRKNRVFVACLRASLVKAFEFSQHVCQRPSEESYFLSASLRGITEDIIYLRYLSKMPLQDREKISRGLMDIEILKMLKHQQEFFSVMRPFQPVLGRGDIDVKEVEKIVRTVWQAHGWPSLKSVNPPTREIAEKSDSGVLEVVYDFIYRFTSGFVHFNPQILLRSGWGENKNIMKFSTKNMDLYYSAFCRIYGTYLLCLYFEFFNKFFRAGPEIKEIVSEIREALMIKPRWPEMVTFEEMNVDVPQPSEFSMMMGGALYAVISRDGFIRGAEYLIRSDQRQPRRG
jgi:hypothetical protein